MTAPTRRSTPMRILVTDDHAILRQGLKQIILGQFAGAQFGEAGDAAQTLALLHKQSWDVLVLDINLPGRNGFEVLDEVRRNFPLLPVLVLSSTPEDQLGLRVTKAGAAGYLNKQTAPEQLVQALQAVLAGGQFISAALGARWSRNCGGAPTGRGTSSCPRAKCKSAN